MITPENAVRLARARRARGGETWLPVPDVALYTGVPVKTLHLWANSGKVRRRSGGVDLGQVLVVRDRSTVRVPETPITYRTLTYYRHVANGWTTVEIANEYGVSLDAVHHAIQEANRALRARNRTHAVALLMARELISSADVAGALTGGPRQMAGNESSMSEGA